MAIRWLAFSTVWVLCGCGVPSTFEQVRAATGGARQGTHAALVLDGDEQPLVAYLDEASGGAHALRFTRHDASRNAWTAPVTVADGLGEVDLLTGRNLVSLARDASTGRLGVAFMKNEQFCDGANKEDTVHVSFSTDQGATWSVPERVSEARYLDTVEVCNTTMPRIAMHGGKVHVAWAAAAGELESPTNFFHGYHHAVSSGSGWTVSLLPRVGATGAKGADVLDLAVDASGSAAVAYVMQDTANGNTRYVGFFRPGGAAVKVTDTGNTQNDNPRLSLAFDGNKPRVATQLVRPAKPDFMTYELFESDDGAAFTGRALPTDGQDSGNAYLDLVYAGGRGLLVHDYGSSGATAPGASGGPKLLRGQGGSWTIAGADTLNRQFLGEFAAAALTADGKALVAFFTDVADSAPAARFGPGLVLYRER